MKDKQVRMVIKLGVINEAKKNYQIPQEYHKIHGLNTPNIVRKIY